MKSSHNLYQIVGLAIILALAGCVALNAPASNDASGGKSKGLTPAAPGVYPAPGNRGSPIPTSAANDAPVIGSAYPPPGEKPTNPWAAQPGDGNLTLDEAFIETQEVLILESFPPQFILHITGTIPTPCHQPRVEILTPGNDNRLEVQVYSVADPDSICTMVLEPFDIRVTLNDLPPGTYQVLVNGKATGSIDVP